MATSTPGVGTPFGLPFLNFGREGRDESRRGTQNYQVETHSGQTNLLYWATLNVVIPIQNYFDSIFEVIITIKVETETIERKK